MKQKLRLYFDENVPPQVVAHFSTSKWSKKVKTTSAMIEGNTKRSDRFHYQFCLEQELTLVTLDMDFNNDSLFPFTQGRMHGLIIIRASSDEAERIVDVLERLLTFLMSLRLPKIFLFETKFIAGTDTVLMRGRDLNTKDVKSLQVIAGSTSFGEILRFFGY